MDRQTLGAMAVIAAAAVLAPVLAELLKRFRIPGVVIELLLGIAVGPQVLKLAHTSEVIDSFADLGLSFLMFLAGYEIDMAAIRGKPLARASVGWIISLVLGLAVGGLLAGAGFALSGLIVGLALTTTALGTLLPMLRDEGVLATPFGGFIMGVGTLGEFAPVVAIALLLTTDRPLWTAVLLLAFVGLAVVAALLAARPRSPRALEMLRRNLHSSSQLPVRVSVLLVVLLVWIASALGLDVLLGAFAAGVVVRLFTAGRDAETVRIKLEAIGFGFLVPLFFVVSGMRFDLDALTGDISTMLRLPLFLVLFLAVRGTPALLLYRRDLPRLERAALAFFSATALPLVVVITSIGLRTGRMRPENAAALVGAGMLSVLVYPIVAFALERRAARSDAGADADPERFR